MKNIASYFSNGTFTCFVIALLSGIFVNNLDAQEGISERAREKICQNLKLEKVPVEIANVEKFMESLKDLLANRKEHLTDYESLIQRYNSRLLRLELLKAGKHSNLTNLNAKFKIEIINVKYYSNLGAELYTQSFSTRIESFEKGRAFVYLDEVVNSNNQNIDLPEDFYVKIELPDIFKIINPKVTVPELGNAEENEFIFKLTIKKGSGDIALHAKPKFIFYFVLPLLFLGYFRNTYPDLFSLNSLSGQGFNKKKIRKVRSYLEKGDIDRAIEIACRYCPATLRDDLTILKSRYHRIKDDESAGKLNREQYYVQVNTITSTILRMIKS